MLSGFDIQAAASLLSSAPAVHAGCPGEAGLGWVHEHLLSLKADGDIRPGLGDLPQLSIWLVFLHRFYL